MLWSTEEVATRTAWRLAELLRHPDVEEAPSRTDTTADPAAPSYSYDWVWRPFTPNTSAAMLAIAGRIAYLLDKGPADLIPQDTECIDTRIGLPIAALGITPGSPNYTGAIQLLAKEFVNEQKIATIPYLFASHVQDAYDRASHNDAPSSSATRLAGELFDQRHIDPHYRRMIELLTWPVRAQVLSNLVAGHRRATQKHWIQVTDTPRSSGALWVVAGLATAASLLGTSGIAIYRAVMAITGSWPLGPEWLAWLSLASFALLVVTLFILYRAFMKTLPKWFYVKITVSLLIASLLTLTYGVIVAMITIVYWIGWTVIPIVALIAALIGALAMVAAHRDKVNSNVLRHCLNADRQVQLGRRSVIAGPQAS